MSQSPVLTTQNSVQGIAQIIFLRTQKINNNDISVSSRLANHLLFKVLYNLVLQHHITYTVLCCLISCQCLALKILVYKLILVL